MYRKPFHKCIAAAVISGLSSALNSGLNFSGGIISNATNREIAKMNNETMIQLMREQTKIEQNYNSRSAQMQRDMMAGVNPMLSAGAQPAQVSSASVPSLDTPVMQNPFVGVDFGGDKVASAFLQSKQIDNTSRQLDIQQVNSDLTFLQIVSDLAKSENVTSDDINNLIKMIYPNDDRGVGALGKDSFVKTRLANAVETSDLDLKEKKYLFDWLDEFTNARFTNLLADNEQKQTQSNVNRSLSNLNDAKKKEVDQAVENMKQQFKSLEFQGEVDAARLKHAVDYAEALVKKLVSEAKFSEKEARYYIWTKINETMSSLPVSIGIKR